MSLWVAWHEVVSCVEAVIHGRSKDTLDRWQIPADLACCGTALAQRMSLHTGRKRTRGSKSEGTSQSESMQEKSFLFRLLYSTEMTRFSSTETLA